MRLLPHGQARPLSHPRAANDRLLHLTQLHLRLRDPAHQRLLLGVPDCATVVLLDAALEPAHRHDRPFQAPELRLSLGDTKQQPRLVLVSAAAVPGVGGLVLAAAQHGHRRSGNLRILRASRRRIRAAALRARDCRLRWDGVPERAAQDDAEGQEERHAEEHQARHAGLGAGRRRPIARGVREVLKRAAEQPLAGGGMADDPRRRPVLRGERKAELRRVAPRRGRRPAVEQRHRHEISRHVRDVLSEPSEVRDRPARDHGGAGQAARGARESDAREGGGAPGVDERHVGADERSQRARVQPELACAGDTQVGRVREARE